MTFLKSLYMQIVDILIVYNTFYNIYYTLIINDDDI